MLLYRCLRRIIENKDDNNAFRSSGDKKKITYQRMDKSTSVLRRFLKRVDIIQRLYQVFGMTLTFH